MAFQEQADPLIEELQHAIDELRFHISDQEFQSVLRQIDTRFPFVDLSEFLEMYVDGEHAKMLIEMFHLSGYAEYQKLLQILKLPKKRKSTQKTEQSRKINLKSRKLETRYEFLHEALSRFLPTIKNKIAYNVLRSVVLFHLYSNMHDFTNEEKVISSIPSAIDDFEHFATAPHMSLSTFNSKDVKVHVNSILDELKKEGFLETNDSGEFRLMQRQLQLDDYILNTIRNREGITHQDLMEVIKDKIPVLAQMPPTLLQLTLHNLLLENVIIKKEGYWKFKPSYDEYFTLKYYRGIYLKNPRSGKNSKFFGRKITPVKFVTELAELSRGDFEDQDDQVTRIAGMILANSPMMSHPPNELEEFDFAVDLSSYEFTKEQQSVIQDIGLEIRSNIVYVKVMIDAGITIKELSDLSLKLKNRGKGEQGFIISFAPVGSLVTTMLENDKTIQLISQTDLIEWCKITPVIPSRRGAVAVIRYGRNKGTIVKIKSINYESGMADVVSHDLQDSVQYIGSLDEITLDVTTNQFIDRSSKYFEFLKKLYMISDDSILNSVVVSGLPNSSRMKGMPDVEVTQSKIECKFYGYSKSEIDFMEHPDRATTRYLTDDLFSCTCFFWNHQNRARGLCEHLVFILNESVKRLLSSDSKLGWDANALLTQIEDRMELFLRRLRYANTQDSDITCPNCGCVARTIEQVEKLFGYRQMTKKDKFSLRRQSRCKQCRG